MTSKSKKTFEDFMIRLKTVFELHKPKKHDLDSLATAGLAAVTDRGSNVLFTAARLQSISMESHDYLRVILAAWIMHPSLIKVEGPTVEFFDDSGLAQFSDDSRVWHFIVECDDSTDASNHLAKYFGYAIIPSSLKKTTDPSAANLSIRRSITTRPLSLKKTRRFHAQYPLAACVKPTAFCRGFATKSDEQAIAIGRLAAEPWIEYVEVGIQLSIRVHRAYHLLPTIQQITAAVGRSPFHHVAIDSVYSANLISSALRLPPIWFTNLEEHAASKIYIADDKSISINVSRSPFAAAGKGVQLAAAINDDILFAYGGQLSLESFKTLVSVNPKVALEMANKFKSNLTADEITEMIQKVVSGAEFSLHMAHGSLVGDYNKYLDYQLDSRAEIHRIIDVITLKKEVVDVKTLSPHSRRLLDRALMAGLRGVIRPIYSINNYMEAFTILEKEETAAKGRAVVQKKRPVEDTDDDDDDSLHVVEEDDEEVSTPPKKIQKLPLPIKPKVKNDLLPLTPSSDDEDSEMSHTDKESATPSPPPLSGNVKAAASILAGIAKKPEIAAKPSPFQKRVVF